MSYLALLSEMGLAPLDGKYDESVGTVEALCARTYIHPALPGQPVIVLNGETLGVADDGAMSYLGFDEPAVGPALSYIRQRGQGYPEWALVNDPQSAAIAFQTGKGIARAARMAKSRPGAAFESFEELASKLPPSHLPTFWETAGRAYIAAESSRQAAVCFGRARIAERTYVLTIDEDVRRDAYLEYAFAGALSAKALNEYLADLKLQYEPTEVFRRFEELAVRRTRGGLPPWTAMTDSLRRLASKAGKNPSEEERRIVRELLAMPATMYAPSGFWKKSMKVVIEVCRQDREFRDALLDAFPTGVDKEVWFEILEESGSLAGLKGDPSGPMPREGAAAWLSTLIGFSQGGWRGLDRFDFAIALIPQIATALQADGKAVQFNRSMSQKLPLQLVAALLTAETPFELNVYASNNVKDTGKINLGPVLSWPDPSALSVVTADPRYEFLVDNAIREHLARVDEILATPELRPGLTRVIERWTSTAESAGLVKLAEYLPLLEKVFTPMVAKVFPEHVARVANVPIARGLQQILRGGILDEYGWPAFDDYIENAGACDLKVATTTWPALTVFNKQQVAAIGPDGVWAEHGLPRHLVDQLSGATYSDGDFLVNAWIDHEHRCYWLSRPDEPLPEELYYYPSSAVNGQMPLVPAAPGGAAITSSGALRVGEVPKKAGDVIVTDGTDFWRFNDSRDQWEEFDSVTGQVGRVSLPAIFDSTALPSGARVVSVGGGVVIRPAGVESPMAVHDRYLGVLTVNILDESKEYQTYGWRPDGTWEEGDGANLIRFPGVENSLRLSGNWDTRSAYAGDLELWNVTLGHTHFSLPVEDTKIDGAAGTPFVPPTLFWNYFQPRDLVGSKALREIDDRTVDKLLVDAARFCTGAEDLSQRSQAEAALAQMVDALSDTAFTDLRLRAGVAGWALTAAVLKSRCAAIGGVSMAAPGAERKAQLATRYQLDREVMVDQLGDLLVGYLYEGQTPAMVSSIIVTSQFFQGEVPASAVQKINGQLTRVGWFKLARFPGVIALRALSPIITPEQRAELIILLRLLSETIFANDDDGSRQLRVFQVDEERGEGDITYSDEGVAVVTSSNFRNLQALSRGTGVETARRILTTRGDVVSESGPGPHWGRAEQIQSVAQIAETEPPAWDRVACQDLSERTGMPVTAAALLLAGGYGSYEFESLIRSATSRSVFGFKAGELAGGHSFLKEKDHTKLMTVIDVAFPQVAQTLHEGGFRVLADNLAAAWIEIFGVQTVIDEELRLEASRRTSPYGLDDQLVALVAPETSPLLNSVLDESNETDEYDAFPSSSGSLLKLRELLPWAYATQPLGSAAITALPKAIELVRARLSEPSTTVHLASEYRYGEPYRVDETLEQTIGRVLAVPNIGAGEEQVFDNGLLKVSVDSPRVEFYYRPSQAIDERWTAAMAAFSRLHNTESMSAVEFLRSSGVTRLAERVVAIAQAIADGALAPDAYESNPNTSAPELVSQVAQTKSLSEDEASYWLQLLALPEPTDANVKVWNKWTTARLTKARTALLESGLVVEAKRARAGRKVFLPGPWWEADSPLLPIEKWKARFYNLSGTRKVSSPTQIIIPDRPLGEIFTLAWQAVQNGEGPQ